MMKKKILFSGLVAALATNLFAQDNATQQQLDKLSGQIQDLLDAQAQTGKHLEAMEKEISDLRDKVNTPAVNNSANADDLKKLAEQVQEIDKKRQDDRELILKEIEKLGKVAGGAPVHIKSTANTTPTTTDADATAANTPKTGYYYVVKDGDTLSAIAKTYRDSDKHVKVTSAQILAANPGLDANKLYTGKKIFIPDPNAK